LPFISKIGKTEVTHGILEEEFSLKTWKEALSVFEKVEATIKPVFFGPNSSFIRKQNAWKNPGIVTRVLITLQGGGIEGLGVKKGRLIVKKDIERVFICPDCGQATLKKEAVLVCLNCKRNFGPKNGVLMLLSLKLQKKLYG
jgi:ribosomal protein L37AE/L43A